MISTQNIEKNITEAPEEMSAKTRPRKKGMGGKLSGLLLIAVIVLAILYIQQKREVSRLSDPVAQAEYAQKEVEKVISELKRTVVVADDEDLKLVGVINDAETLKKDQPFYANVQTGDYVFLFSKSSRALIWRPSENKVVNFGVADTTQAQQQGTQQSVAPSTNNATTTDDKDKN